MKLAKKKAAQKTNAARILDNLKIEYELMEYPVDEEDLSAVHVAASVGLPVDMVFKTLVIRADKDVIMCCIPGAAEVDLKKLAAISDHKRCELVPLKDVLGLTGYIRGGCSPLGAKKAYPVFIHQSINEHEKITVSAGKRGAQLVLAPADLIKATNAVVGDVIH